MKSQKLLFLLIFNLICALSGWGQKPAKPNQKLYSIYKSLDKKDFTFINFQGKEVKIDLEDDLMFKQYALESYFAHGIAFAYKQQSGNKRRYYAVDHSGKVKYDFGSLIPYEINGNKIVVESKGRKIGLMNLDFSAVKYYDYQDIHEFL